MTEYYLKQFGLLKYILMLVLLILFQYAVVAQPKIKPRVLISTDIGGTDPDDNQSMIHLLMYSNEVNIEGLISTSFITGRKQNITEMIELYEKDLPKLKTQAKGFPTPAGLKKICKQGAITGAPFKGYTTATEGSRWIVACAKKKTTQPLWVLVWGGIEDVAQALHDAPEIKKNIRVYWIGGPNKKWGVNAYAYIAKHHPDLWMIEANATYRGWFMDAAAAENLKAPAYYNTYIKNSGAMGKAFVNYYSGNIKMGDTPSFAYLLHGTPDDPGKESWGGSFVAVNRSARALFTRNTTIADTVATYAVVEWQFKGPTANISPDSICFTLEVAAQKWPGYYLGNGTYGVRYSPKQIETANYITHSTIKELDGQIGAYVSTVPWPGKPCNTDYLLGKHWYSDRTNPELFIGTQQGAQTIAKYREAYLMDWAKRWNWIK